MSHQTVPLTVAPLIERRRRALPKMIEQQKEICFRQIKSRPACDVLKATGNHLCPSCKRFKDKNADILEEYQKEIADEGEF